MKLLKADIIERLRMLDADAALLDDTDQRYSCIIVGGSALVLLDKSNRATHDIDSIRASAQILPLLEAYNININVTAYYLSFPEDYISRLKHIAIKTEKIDYYTLSLEDLVISKLSAQRDKDIEDISRPEVYESLDWTLLDRLIDDVCYGMLNDFDVIRLRTSYQSYKERFYEKA